MYSSIIRQIDSKFKHFSVFCIKCHNFPICFVRYVQTLRLGRTSRRALLPMRDLLAAAGSLFEGIAIYAFLHGGIVLVGADIDYIQCAVVLAAHIVAALVNSAMNVGVLLLVHHGRKISFRFVFARQSNGLSCRHIYSMHKCGAVMHCMEFL